MDYTKCLACGNISDESICVWCDRLATINGFMEVTDFAKLAGMFKKTQAELAGMLGVSRQAVANWHKGKPAPVMAIQCLKAYRVFEILGLTTLEALKWAEAT